MTKDTFVRTVKRIVEERGVKVFSSKESKLAAIGRQVESREIDIKEAVEKVREVFSDEYALGRKDFSAIEKALR